MITFKTMKIDWTNFIEVRDKLICLQSNNERRKLLYEWMSKGRISFKIFDMLIYYVS